ncbi:DUF5908 family protein [Reichenbachiella versicolor]|uniref:DUF5908 family protein n=1 Tax=Reichenbachiella versicolor TaxID=1821036 RepID=UPI0013A5A9E6|nr:DUF5908 family protein [Reichenbachiella versicolor]
MAIEIKELKIRMTVANGTISRQNTDDIINKQHEDWMVKKITNRVLERIKRNSER